MANDERPSTRILILSILILAATMAACATPRRIGPTATSRPGAAITATPKAIATTTTPPITVTLAPISVRPTVPIAPALEIAPLPTIVSEIDLGVRLEQPLQHAVALDADYGRIFVGAPPDKTLILSTDAWRITDTLPVGGNVAIDHVRGRLFVGAPGGVAVFDLDSLDLAGTISITSSISGSTPVVDESNGTLFVVNNGVYIASPTSLATARISGTFPTPGGMVPNYFAVDAAVDAQNRRLYISLNNGIPGSNNGNTLTVYDLKSGTTIYQDGERSIVSLEADESSGRLFVTRSRMNDHSLAVLEGGTRPALRINGITGSIQVDAQRGRLYLSEGWGASSRLLVLDLATGALIGDVPLPRAYTLAAFDVEADRLYLVSPDGHLLVMSGHGGPAPTPEPKAPGGQAFEPAGVLTTSVAWVAPSPDFPNDRMLFAAWSLSQYPAGPLGSRAGRMFASADGGATWGRVRGGLPPYLFVNALAFSPDFARDRTLFASLLSPNGTGGGLYVSNDAERSWRPATQGLNDWIVAEIAVAPGFPFNRTLFALTWQGGLFRSTDGGETWQRTSYRAGPPVGMTSQTLAISPDFVNDQTLVVSTGESASISRDGGENWWPFVASRATTLAFSPDFARDHTLLGSFTELGVARSDDGGATWRATSRGLRFDSGDRVVPALSPDFARDRVAFTLIQSFDRSALYRTVDGGASWQIESTGTAGMAQITTLNVSPDWAHDGSILLGLTDGRLRWVKASDLKWSNVPAALDKLSVEAIAVSPDYASDRAVFIGNARAGVFVSTDGGARWQETNFPARDAGMGRLLLALSPNYANDRSVFASAAGQTFRSDDGGATWQFLSGLGSFFPASSLAVSPQFTDDHTLLVGGGYRAPRAMRSTDAGQTWSAASGLLQNSGVLALAFVPGNGRVAYAWADQSGLYRSGDGGATWTRVFSPTLSGATGWSIQSLAISPDFAHDRLMFGGFVGAQNFRRSADGGATWHPSGAGFPPGLIWGSALALSPDFARDPLVFLGTDKGVFRSEDGGVTWKASSTGLPPGAARVLSLALSPNFLADHTIFAGLAERGLYVSTDAGSNWKLAR